MRDCFYFFFFKQKTAYEMRISDWSSDVCSSDLRSRVRLRRRPAGSSAAGRLPDLQLRRHGRVLPGLRRHGREARPDDGSARAKGLLLHRRIDRGDGDDRRPGGHLRSEEHTSELQSLMRISYAVFCLTTKNDSRLITHTEQN